MCRIFATVALAALITFFLLCTALYITEPEFEHYVSLSKWPKLSSLNAQFTSTSDQDTDHQQSKILLGPPLAAPHNTTEPQAALVIATTSSQSTQWLQTELHDLLNTQITPYIYVTNNLNAPLHTPANKGHETMAYLTYIIETYTSLPPISIFIHNHRTAWHNNPLLSMSTSKMIRNLKYDKVERDGYFNLRCHWDPGCPAHIHPFAMEYDDTKAEELLVKDAWMEIFNVDEDSVPKVLAQPCCSQFAVKRDRILSLPLDKYVSFRNWLLNTNLEDYYSGRMFEYFWQYIFVGKEMDCPDPRVCYCEGFGICFEEAEGYDEWFGLRAELERLKGDLTELNQGVGGWKLERRDYEAGKGLEVARYGLRSQEARFEEWERGFAVAAALEKRHERGGEDEVRIEAVEQGSYDRSEQLRTRIEDLQRELEIHRQAGLQYGKVASNRAAAVEAALSVDPARLEKAGTLFWKRDEY